MCGMIRKCGREKQRGHVQWRAAILRMLLSLFSGNFGEITGLRDGRMKGTSLFLGSTFQ